MKRSHKLRSLGDVAAVVQSSPTLAIAAKRLGVNASTLYRWIHAGKVKAPRPLAGAVTDVQVPPTSQTPDEWAASVRADRTLTKTQEQLVDGAVLALKMSRDTTVGANVRLSALARFQALVRDLNPDGEAKAQERPQERQRRPSIDPRSVLMAVK